MNSFIWHKLRFKIAIKTAMFIISLPVLIFTPLVLIYLKKDIEKDCGKLNKK